MPTPPAQSQAGTQSSGTTSIQSARQAIREEYLAPHAFPWIIGFSGGKDSTLTAQLVIECLLNLSRDQRTRPITILYNDTQVESPVFAQFVERQISRIREGVEALGLPVSVITTKPDPSDTFWINLLGKGYPAPNRNFRWCMDRLKIRPSASYLRETVASAGGAILLLGVRRAESAARAQRLKKFAPENEQDRVVPNYEVPGCSIFRPIIDLTTDEVWDYLRSTDPGLPPVFGPGDLRVSRS